MLFFFCMFWFFTCTNFPGPMWKSCKIHDNSLLWETVVYICKICFSIPIRCLQQPLVFMTTNSHKCPSGTVLTEINVFNSLIVLYFFFHIRWSGTGVWHCFVQHNISAILPEGFLGKIFPLIKEKCAGENALLPLLLLSYSKHSCEEKI